MSLVPFLAHFRTEAPLSKVTTSTFADLLNEYLFVGPRPVRYWQNYKERLRYRGIDYRTIPNCRARVLERWRKRAKKRGERYFKELVLHRSPLMDLIAKDDSWTGGNLIVPLRFGSPALKLEWDKGTSHVDRWK